MFFKSFVTALLITACFVNSVYSYGNPPYPESVDENGVVTIHPYDAPGVPWDDSIEIDVPCMDLNNPSSREKVKFEEIEIFYDENTDSVELFFWFGTSEKLCDYELSKDNLILSDNKKTIINYELKLIAVDKRMSSFRDNSTRYKSWISRNKYKITYKAPFSLKVRNVSIIKLSLKGHEEEIYDLESYKKPQFASLFALFRKKKSDVPPVKTSNQSIKYIEYTPNTHVVIVNYSNSQQICFKAHVGLNHKIGDKNSDGSLKKEFKASFFSELVTDQNAILHGKKAVVAVNTDFVGTNAEPLSINVVQGNDYSGPREWTSMAISKQNDITFVNEIPKEAYNITGGGPRLYNDKGEFISPGIRELGLKTYLYQKQRSVIGITSNKKLIIIVSDKLEISEINDLLQLFATSEGGTIVGGNMFDGGGSPSLMYKGKFLREGNNNLSAALLIFEGKACTN